MASPIEYEYIGPSDIFVDAHTRTGVVWIGKSEIAGAKTATQDLLRGQGNIKAIGADKAERFEAIYVNVENPLFKRVTPDEEAEKAKAEGAIDAVPAGTRYSGYTAEQIREVYVNKLGKKPSPKKSVATLLKEIQVVDAGADAGLVGNDPVDAGMSDF